MQAVLAGRPVNTHRANLSRLINRPRSSRRHTAAGNGQSSGTVIGVGSRGSTPANASAHVGSRPIARRYRKIDAAMPGPIAAIESADKQPATVAPKWANTIRFRYTAGNHTRCPVTGESGLGTITFVHPVVRAAVYSQLGSGPNRRAAPGRRPSGGRRRFVIG